MDYIDYYKDSQLFFHHNMDLPPFTHRYGMHAHEIYEIFYLISGEGTITIEGKPYPLRANSLYIMRSNEAHYTTLTNTKPYERIILHFFPDAISMLDPDERLLAPFNNRNLGEQNMYTLDIPSSIIIDNAFKNISIYPQADAYNKRLYTLTSLLTILMEINKAYKQNMHYSPMQAKYPIIDDVIAYINEHLFEKLSTEDLCHHFFISRSHLCARFKECTSSTIWNYILVKRLVASKTMLQNGIPAKEVACICGYQDYSAFYRAYKKHFGTPPASDY